MGILGSIFGSNKKTPAGAVNLEAEDEKAIVSDRFVEEAIETVTLLGELAAEMEATPDREAKASMKESFELLQKELQSKIMAD